jgi:hypothetical protein
MLALTDERPRRRRAERDVRAFPRLRPARTDWRTGGITAFARINEPATLEAA